MPVVISVITLIVVERPILIVGRTIHSTRNSGSWKWRKGSELQTSMFSFWSLVLMVDIIWSAASSPCCPDSCIGMVCSEKGKHRRTFPFKLLCYSVLFRQQEKILMKKRNCQNRYSVYVENSPVLREDDYENKHRDVLYLWIENST